MLAIIINQKKSLWVVAQLKHYKRKLRGLPMKAEMLKILHKMGFASIRIITWKENRKNIPACKKGQITLKCRLEEEKSKLKMDILPFQFIVIDFILQLLIFS